MRLPNFVTEALVRRRVRFDVLTEGRFKVRVARTVQDYEQAFRLVHAGYVVQGIESPLDPDLRVTEQHVLPEATVLLAYEGDRAVGTMTVTIDSPAGLPLDKDYPESLRELRRTGARLAEFGSFTIVSRCRGSGVAQLLSLAALRVSVQCGATDIVIGVHPKTIPFYRGVWGFDALGEPKAHAQLTAPVVGMHMVMAASQAHLRRHYSRPLSSGYGAADYLEGVARIPGFEMPDTLPMDALARWKMPRDVFQALFRDRTNVLAQLSPTTSSYLRQKRSDRTVGRLPLERVA
jgi:hypothetical protein